MSNLRVKECRHARRFLPCRGHYWSVLGHRRGNRPSACRGRLSCCADRASDRALEALAEELGNDALAIGADVTDRGSVAAAAQRVQEEAGGADILVNNAGVMLLGPFSRQLLEANLLGAITVTELFLDQFAQRRRRSRKYLVRCGPYRQTRQRRLRRDQVGHQRLVGIAAPGAPA